MRVITREEWGAIHGRGNPTSGAKLHLYVHHAAGRSPAPSLAAESQRVRDYEEQHARTLTPSNPRIGYTALIGQSGRVYEGTGLGYIGAHTAGRNSSSWGVCFLLDGRVEKPSDAAIIAFYEWRLDAVRDGQLHPRHDAGGHRDVVATTCPGDIVYDLLVRRVEQPVIDVEREAAIAPMPSLRKGSGGRAAPPDLREAVRQLQRMLGMPDRLRTGFFGDETDKRVHEFQREKGLVQDGIVGVRTWGALLA